MIKLESRNEASSKQEAKKRIKQPLDKVSRVIRLQVSQQAAESRMNMTEIDNSSILEKIAQLFALAQSSASVAEAENAANAAQKLLSKHRLTRADLLALQGGPDEEAPEAATEPLFSANRIPRWKKDLAGTAATANGCRVYYSKVFINTGGGQHRRRAEYKNNIILVGRPSDIAVVRYLFGYLTGAIERLSAMANAGGSISGKSAGTSFKVGAGQSVGAKLYSAQADAQDAAQAEYEAGTSNAIVALKNSDAEVTEFYNTLGLRKGKAESARNLDCNAVALGQKAGQGISINKGLGGGSSCGNSTKVLTG